MPLIESGSSQESLESYFARKMEEMSLETATLPARNFIVLPIKASCGEGLAVTPGDNRNTLGQ